jgi:hypothetical protein
VNCLPLHTLVYHVQSINNFIIYHSYSILVHGPFWLPWRKKLEQSKSYITYSFFFSLSFEINVASSTFNF